MTPHFMALNAAYQLHFYLCFKTKYLRPMLDTSAAQVLVQSVLQDVCAREQYHLLETDVTPDHLRLLLSLKPVQTVSDTVRMLKGNLDQRFRVDLRDELKRYRSTSLWAKGYFARSAGKVDLEAARNYVDSQVNHHGYQGNWTRALKYRNPEFKSPAFSLPHSVCVLNYHLVLATQSRTALFDERIAPGLFDYIVAIGKKHHFAVDRIGLLPDHMHLTVEAVPNASVEECVRALMNNTRYWMENKYRGVLKETKAWDVWQPSYYAGTVGEYTTAQVKKFLANSV